MFVCQFYSVPSLGNSPVRNFAKMTASIFNHNGALGNIFVTLITVAGIMSSFLRYEFFTIIHNSTIGTAVYTTVWVTLLISSIWCSVVYTYILYDCSAVVRSIWTEHGNIWRVLLMTGLCGFSMVSIWSLCNEMSILFKEVEENFQPFWQGVYHALFYARITQRSLACESCPLKYNRKTKPEQ